MRTALIAVIVCFAVVARADDAEVVRWKELATTTHKKAQQSHDPKRYDEAAGYYANYFAKPDADEGVMAFYYGELLFNLQRYDEAANYYERYLTVAPKGPMAQEAAYAFVMSAKNAIKPESRTDGKAPCPEMKPCAIPADDKRLLGALDRYLAIVAANDKHRAAMEYRRAKLYHDYQHFAEAAPAFDHVLATYPDTDLATYSANLEMDCLAILKRYGELRALVDRVKANPALMKDATTQQQVRDNDAALKKRGK